MAITLRHLCQQAKEDYGMQLLCGEKNMNSIVNWVHMLEDPETASFLHGHELIFSTGIGHDTTDWYIDFVKGLVKHQACGLVLNIGPYIEAVPDELLDYCQAVNFPLFTIPWKTRIVDITNDFCHKIIRAEENEMTVASAFKNIIFFPEKISDYRSLLVQKAFDLDAEFCVVAVALIVPSNEDLIDYEKIVRMHLTKILYNHSDRFSLFRQDRCLLAVLQSFPQTVINESFQRLKTVCNYRDASYQIRIGIGMNDFGILSLSRNYKRSMAVLRLAEKQKKHQMSYSEIGVHQLLIEVEDMKVLRKFYEDTLGPLEDYDKKHSTDYLRLLQMYLDYNNSVEKVAKETFVHRNTVNYKIKKIKEILKCDLDYQDGLKLYLAFQLKEFL